MEQPRILIIDDDPNLRKTLGDILRSRGFEPSAAANGVAGLATMKEHSFNLVLIDLGLPDIPGVEVLRKIKAEHPLSEVIILTGNATLDSAIEAANSGAFSYLVKPYEIEQLILNIQRAIEKKRAEIALQKSEERFRKIFEEGPLGMAITDSNNRFVKVNEMLCRMLGYTEEELATLKSTDIYCAADMENKYKNMRQLIERGLPFYKTEKRCTKKSGELFWVNKTASAIIDPESDTSYFLEMFEDITKRKAAEEAILGAKEEWERTFDAIIDPIMIVDTEHRIVKANKAMVNKLGVKPSDTQRMVCHEILHGTTEPPPFCPHARMLADGRPHSVETDVARLGGDFLIVVSPLYDAEGKLQGSIHFSRDITERKSLEKQLQHSQKMEAIGTLAGGIAHDFNNILTAITGFATLLKMHMDNDKQLTSYVEEILNGSDRAARLTRSLLTFSRKQEIKLKLTNLNEVISGVEKMLRRLIREDIILGTRLASEDLVVMADAGQIEQVLINLAANARDAINENGMITIRSKLVELGQEFRMAHGYGKPGSYALLTFTDSGTGMDEKTRQRIFEPYFTTKEVDKGTGLGLSVAYGIIKQHNGFITCYSEPGRGTTFRIYLPVFNMPAENRKSAPDLPLPRGNETILLAEDDSQTRRLSRMILENFGYRVIEAANGEEAVAQFTAHKDEIRIVLLDVIMPRKNGKEAFRLMEQIKPGTKVIFVSGYTADIFKKDEKFEEGINFLSKPILHKELLVTLRNLLDT
jgi:two-component system, cell cycle sensor histidine kinase and response regulator CckA